MMMTELQKERLAEKFREYLVHEVLGFGMAPDPRDEEFLLVMQDTTPVPEQANELIEIVEEVLSDGSLD